MTFLTHFLLITTSNHKNLFQTAWKCLKDNKVEFAIVRIYQSNGQVDPNGEQNIKHARAAGIKDVDGYIFPCQKCGNPKGQVQAALNELNGKNAKIDQVSD